MLFTIFIIVIVIIALKSFLKAPTREEFNTEPSTMYSQRTDGMYVLHYDGFDTRGKNTKFTFVLIFTNSFVFKYEVNGIATLSKTVIDEILRDLEAVDDSTYLKERGVYTTNVSTSGRNQWIEMLFYDSPNDKKTYIKLDGVILRDELILRYSKRFLDYEFGNFREQVFKEDLKFKFFSRY